MIKPPTTQSVIAALRKAGLHMSSTYMSVSKCSDRIEVTFANYYDHESRSLKPRVDTAAKIVDCLRAKGWAVQETLHSDKSYTLAVREEAPHGLA